MGGPDEPRWAPAPWDDEAPPPPGGGAAAAYNGGAVGRPPDRGCWPAMPTGVDTSASAKERRSPLPAELVREEREGLSVMRGAASEGDGRAVTATVEETDCVLGLRDRAFLKPRNRRPR